MWKKQHSDGKEPTQNGTKTKNKKIETFAEVVDFGGAVGGDEVRSDYRR